MPWAAKAGSGTLAGCSMLVSEAPCPGNAQGSVSVHDFGQSHGCSVLLHTGKVQSAAEGPRCALQQQQQCWEAPEPLCHHCQHVGLSSPAGEGQPAHFNTHLTCQQPTLTAPGDLPASSPYATATTQQTISTGTEESFTFLFPSVFMFPQTCSAAISTELHFRHHLGYRAVALLAWVTNPASGVEIKPEPIFITFSKEKAAFSALQNNVRVCNMFLICHINVQAASLDGSFRQDAFILTWAQPQWGRSSFLLIQRDKMHSQQRQKLLSTNTSAAPAWNSPDKGEALV